MNELNKSKMIEKEYNIPKISMMWYTKISYIFKFDESECHFSLLKMAVSVKQGEYKDMPE
jgi:hypothetical protein